MPHAESAASLARDRSRRKNVAVPARAKQAVDARNSKRKDRDESAAKQAAQAEIDARPKPSHDDDNYIFGSVSAAAKPLDETSREAALAKVYLRKIATRDGEDYRAAYEAGEIGLAELRELAIDPDANNPPPPNQSAKSHNTSSSVEKGKGRVTESQVATNYKGITVGDTSYVVQSKHAEAAARRNHKTTNRKPQPSVAPATQPAPLRRTDSTTIYPGKVTYPATPLSAPQHTPHNQHSAVNQTPAHIPASNPGGAGRPSNATTTPGSTRGAGPTPSTTQQQRHKQQHGNQPARKHAQTPTNASSRDGAIRRSHHSAASRHTPIPMGSRPPSGLRGKTAPANASRHASRRRRASSVHPPAHEAAQEVNDAEATDSDIGADSNASPKAARATQAVTRKSRPSIRCQDLDTQLTVKTWIDTALPKIVANGTYEYIPSDPSAKLPSREEVAVDSWGQACTQTNRDLPMQPSYIKILDAQVTTSRSRAKMALKPCVDKYLGFDADNHANNIILSKKFIRDGFHQQDPENDRCPFQSDFIRRACRAVAFEGDHALASKCQDSFLPLPKSYVAYVCTITQHIINCYRDGPFLTEHLNEPMQMAVFRRYISLLDEFEQNQPNIFSDAIGRLNDYCHASIDNKVTVSAAPPEPMRRWSPDVAERYVCKYQAPPSDMKMDPGDASDDVEYPPDAEDEEPIPGPSRHRDAYDASDVRDTRDDVLVDVEMDDGDQDSDRPVGSDSDDEDLVE